MMEIMHDRIHQCPWTVAGIVIIYIYEVMQDVYHPEYCGSFMMLTAVKAVVPASA